MPDIKSFKLYMRIEDDAENSLLEMLLKAAKKTIEQQTGKPYPKSTDELYDVAIMQLAGHWYQNRTPVEVGTITSEVPFTVQMLISHISLCGDYIGKTP